ncbi:MAG: alkaline phosphatase [Cytophagales bacterium]|nr:alkaline phosphatase [Armatimonadota bacterium]
MRPNLGLICATAALAVGSAPALALPTVTVTPPNSARFLVGQRFDLRVQGRPTAGSAIIGATLTVDGAPVTFSSTDSTSGVSGFNLRGFSVTTPGFHTLQATLSDGTGTSEVRAQFQVIDPRGSRKASKNIIIFLGDGMGTAHRSAARLMRYGVTAGRPNDYLAMEKFPGLGLVTTHSLDSIITDSAPGMGCYTTGNHSNNNQEGVFPATVANAFFQPRVEYLAEYLHRTRGTKTGIVSTSDIEDATPAANAVHTGNRGAGTGICDAYLDESNNTGLAVLMGGGRRWFLPAGQFGSSRTVASGHPALPADIQSAYGVPAQATNASRDLITDFQTAGFAYTSSLTDLNATFASGTPDKLLGLYGYGNMNVSLDKIAKRRGTPLTGSTTFVVDDYLAPDQPMLDEMTTAALTVLNKNNTNGFVLMVEGAHIDKQSHLMDADRTILEMLEFDRSVQVGRTFADQNPGTVVIVLADHECSGFSINGALTSPTGIAGSLANLRNLPSDKAVVDPGTVPARQGVVGLYQAAGFPNYTIAADGYPAATDIDGKLLIGYGGNADRFESWLTSPLPVVDSLLPDNIRADLASKGYATQPVRRADSLIQPDSRGFFIRGQASGVDNAVHTASDIPVNAYSTGNRAFEQFIGIQENTDVFFKLARALFGGY